MAQQRKLTRPTSPVRVPAYTITASLREMRVASRGAREDGAAERTDGFERGARSLLAVALEVAFGGEGAAGAAVVPAPELELGLKRTVAVVCWSWTLDLCLGLGIIL